MISIDGEAIGFCFTTSFKKRQAYDRTAEFSIYLKPGYTGKDLGAGILAFMEKRAAESGIKVLLGIITSENTASQRLLEKCGYEKCAHFREVGEKFGRVLDVVGYQKIIGQ